MTDVASYILKLKEPLKVPLDARYIKPEMFVNKKLNEILDISVREGNTPIKLGEIFDVEGNATAPGDPNNIEINIHGEGTIKMRYLGFKMQGGKIIVNGGIGPLAGYKMRDGYITIKGNARGWLGAKMRGGMIEVFGHAADFIGSKLQGEKPGKGMKGGMIRIHGNAGSNIGAGMAGGAIIIDGNAKNLVGTLMCGGTIVVQGSCGRFTGARMSMGRIVVCGEMDGILPSFYADSIVPKAKAKGLVFEKPFMIFMGDILVDGMGMLFVSYDENVEMLKLFEELIKEVKI